MTENLARNRVDLVSGADLMWDRSANFGSGEPS
jgi:hypothetical protein